jgi:hypothetical protein
MGNGESCLKENAWHICCIDEGEFQRIPKNHHSEDDETRSLCRWLLSAPRKHDLEVQNNAQNPHHAQHWRHTSHDESWSVRSWLLSAFLLTQALSARLIGNSKANIQCSQDLHHCGGNALHMSAIHGNEKEVRGFSLVYAFAQFPLICIMTHLTGCCV